MSHAIDSALSAQALLIDKLPFPDCRTMTRSVTGSWICSQSAATPRSSLSPQTVYESLIPIAALFKGFMQNSSTEVLSWAQQFEAHPSNMLVNYSTDSARIANETMRLLVVLKLAATMANGHFECAANQLSAKCVLKGKAIEITGSEAFATELFALALFQVANRGERGEYFAGLLRTMFADLIATCSITIDAKHQTIEPCHPSHPHLSRRRCRIGYPLFMLHDTGLAIRRVHYTGADGVVRAVDYQVLVNGKRYLIPDEILVSNPILGHRELETWIYNPKMLPCT